MFIRFTKVHDAGIQEGHCTNLTPRIANKFINDGFAEEISEEDFEEFKRNFVKDRTEKAVEVEEEVVEEEVEVQYHTLTEDDIKLNEKECEGLEAGDEVEMTEEGLLIVGANGLFVKKGNV